MSQHIRIPVCIIGAGPGGAATALFLAKVGIESIIVKFAVMP
jgi:menaquinone-9 beta-reductase